MSVGKFSGTFEFFHFLSIDMQFMLMTVFLMSVSLPVCWSIYLHILSVDRSLQTEVNSCTFLGWLSLAKTENKTIYPTAND